MHAYHNEVRHCIFIMKQLTLVNSLNLPVSVNIYIAYIKLAAMSYTFIRFVIHAVFIIKLGWSVCTCLTQLYIAVLDKYIHTNLVLYIH
jgi:hypothetical protein